MSEAFLHRGVKAVIAKLLWYYVGWKNFSLAVGFDDIAADSNAFERHFSVIRDQYTQVTVRTLWCDSRQLRHGSIAAGYAAKHGECAMCQNSPRLELNSKLCQQLLGGISISNRREGRW